MATFSPLILAALILLISWRMYSRIRRLVGRQKSHLWRHWAAAVLFPILVLMLALVGLVNPLALAGLAGGVAAGLGLAWYGLSKTRFETSPEGFFYTPNAHIGIGLSLVFLARCGYRVYQIYVATTAGGVMDAREFGQSPLTLLTFGMLAGYYAAYAVGLLRWRKTAAVPAAATP